MIWLLVACSGKDPAPVGDTAVGALGEGALNPFPSMELVGDDGHLAFPAGLLPQVEGGTAMDVARLNWRDGFSPVQSAIVMLPVDVDAASLPGEGAIGTGGSVRLLDMDTGAEIPMFAELDAHPDALSSGARTLIVRPMAAMTPGHRVAVVLTDAITVGGAPLELEPATRRYRDLVDEVGIPGAVLAWDFPIGDGTAVTRSLAAAVTVPAAYTVDLVRDVDEGADVPAGVWKKITGTFTTDNWLVDDTVFSVGSDGLPERQGTVEAELYVHVPESVRGAAPGTVPVVVFGHGILSDPGDYLDEDDDPSAVVELSNRLGAIFVATVWRGLTKDDQPEAVEVAADFGRFPEITDKLAQGVANNLALIRLVKEGTLLDDATLGGLADRSQVWWYGISLGSIEGMVTLANQTAIDRAVLHVGGSSWSTMLERSSDWPVFEVLVTRGIVDPWERQLLYATSQLLWDPVDPASYTEDLRGRAFLWQEAMGDNQVPNMTTELFVRSAGVPLGTPSTSTPYGITTVALPARAPMLTQFDPGVGYPPAENRPATNTEAHGIPRVWEGCLMQTEHYFESDREVAHYCGSGPCSAISTGE